MNKTRTLTRLSTSFLFLITTFLISNSLLAAGTFYLEPDTVYIISGITNDAFTLDLNIDDDVAGLKGFEAYIAYDKYVLDTVAWSDSKSVFWSLPSGGVISFIWLIEDSTRLLLESLLMGGGLFVDGPGNVFEVTLMGIGAGVVNLDINEINAIDANSDPLPVGATGAVAIVNAPPADFGLNSPMHQENMFLEYGDNITFDWEASFSYYADYSGDGVSYKLYYSTDTAFSSALTDTIATSNTSATVPVSTLDSGRYYWKVEAISDIYGFSKWSTETWHFQINSYSYPEGFILIDPADGEDTLVIYTDTLGFIWQASSTVLPNDSILYVLHYGTSPIFSYPFTEVVYGLNDTAHVVPASELETNRYYWKVRAYNTQGYDTWCSETDWYFDLIVAANPGIFNLLNPTNDVEYNLNGGGIDVEWSESESVIPNDTITYTMYFGPNANLPASATCSSVVVDELQLTMPGDDLPRREWYHWIGKATNRLDFDTLSADIFSFLTYYRGDADGSDAFNLLDITYLISFLYKGGPEPFPYIAGDPDCSTTINLLDITYLISYLYKGGPAPCVD